MKQLTKRFFAILLSLAMVLQLCPFTPVTRAKAETGNYVLKVLTFEDGDYKGDSGDGYWSSLIDEEQYGGTQLYGDDGTGRDDPYWWWDDGNTNLYHEMPSAGEDNYGHEYCYWSYGEAISNYASGNLEECGDYLHQLTVYKAGEEEIVRTGGGHNGSDNFAVHYGYADTSGWGLGKSHLPELQFLNPETGENETHVIDGMWIKLTPYLLNCIVNGNDLTANMGENDILYVKAYGFDANGKEVTTAQMTVCQGQNLIVQDWTYWDLSSLGEVASVKFEINGSSDNGYGFSQPAYFAFDDVTVRFAAAEEACAHVLTKTDAVAANCITEGNTEYYTCSECGKYFSDAEAAEEIEEGSWVTSVDYSNHASTIKKRKAVAASCTQAGNILYYTCASCGKGYADINGTEELEQDSWILPLDPDAHPIAMRAITYKDLGDGTHESALFCKVCQTTYDKMVSAHTDTNNDQICDGCKVAVHSVHALTLVDAVAASCAEAGSIAYYTCSGCDKLFADEAGETEITAEDTVVAATGHNLTVTEAKEATTEAEGNSAYWTCGNCGKFYADEEAEEEIEENSWVIPKLEPPVVEECVDTDDNDFCDLHGEYLGTEETEVLPAKLIIPEGATATFYTGDQGEGYPIAVTDIGVNATNTSIHNYELDVPYGTYSCVVTDDTHNYGGVGFEFPLQTSIYEPSNLTLCLAKFYTTNTSITTVDDFTVNLVAPGKATIIDGENYLDSTISSGKTYVVAPRMVWAYGNQILYNYTVELNGNLAKTYGVSPQINQTFASTVTTIQKKTFSVVALKTFTLTAPTAAETVFYYQINNFNDMVLEGPDRVSSVDNGDGTTTYTVKYPAFANASYRVTQEGYVTAAGYGKDNTSYTVELREGDPASTETAIDSKVGAGSNIEYENSVYLNIDDTKDTNELALAVGETFRLRAFRAAWEIVNSVTANIMIEPDFHYAVLSGEDVVSVTPVTTQCTGNAKGNWMDLKALKAGTAVIAVWYDAIDIGGNTTLSGTYGATDPARYGYVVVNVGEDHTVTFNPVSHDGDWDAEFDTIYYYGESGTFTMKPEGAQAVTVQNLNAATAGAVQTVTAEDGTYNVPVKAGSNLISVTTAEGTDYILVRAKKISYYIENKTTGKTSKDDDFVITRGDELCIHFDQFNMPISKMSGIYNPGYMGTAKTMFTLNGKYTVSSVGTQYDFITDAKSCITFTAYDAGENTLSGGFIQSGSMGDRFGNHRNITDAGRGTNFSAVNVTGYFGSVEDITFNVEDSDAVTFDYASMVALKKGSLFVGESTYNHAGSFSSLTSKTTVNNSVNWTRTTADMASQSQNFAIKANVMAGSYYVTLQLRYWYEGEEVHTADMIAGSDTIIPWSEFPHDADKILNMEVVVTPADPSIGPAKVYSFVWLPGNANLAYVHPMLKGLTATANGETLSLTPAVVLTQTDYTLAVADKTSISLAGSQLQKYTNKTNNTQDKSDTVIVTRMSNGNALDNGTSVLPLTDDKYPVGSWTLDNLDISEADALQIQVISYVDSKYSRTYNIALDKTVSHNLTKVDAVDATCTTPGNVEYWTCADCDLLFADEAGETAITAEETVVPALGHTEEALEAVAASCTETGLTAGRKCSVCGEILVAQEVVPALGHDYGEWTVVTEPSYEADGLKTRSCSRCEESEEVVLPMLQPVTILTQPENYVGKIGDTASFTVVAAGEGLNYQWYYSKDGEKWSKSGVDSAQTATLSIRLIESRNGQMYKCLVTDAGQNQVTSDVVAIEKKTATAAIVEQPVDQWGTVGDTVTFTVETEGEGLTYQWYYSKDGESWGKSGLTGNKTDTLTVAVTSARMNYSFRCVVADAEGNKITSETVRIKKVVTAKVDVTAQTDGAFLAAPETLTVPSDKAEAYGYTDSVDGVSALDVLVAEHEVIFGEAYTEAEAADYLKVSTTNYITTIFGVVTSNCGFTINDQVPVEGELISSDWGDYYMGLTISTAKVVNGDSVNFFLYQDDYSLDNYTFFKDAAGYSRSFETEVGTALNLQVMGYCVAYNGFNYNNLAAVQASCQALEDLQLAIVDAATGSMVDIDDAITDEDGKVALTFDEEGTYLITAYVTAEDIADYYATPAVMTLATVKVVDSSKVLAITSQPESVTDGIVKTTYSFTVGAKGEGLTYRWYYSKDNGETWYTSGMTGYNTDTLSVMLVGARNGQQYRCQIKDANGNVVVSDAATLSLAVK